MNETGRRVREQYANTGGFTDHVFAACLILGYAFVPRIRGLPSKRLYVFERAGVPNYLRSSFRGRRHRHDELVARLPHGEHGARRFPHDLLGHAAEQQVLDRAAPVRSC